MTGRGRYSRQKNDRPRGVPSRGPGLHRRAAKAAGGIVCQDCGVILHAGRWYFGAPPVAQLSARRCPACQRIRDEYPAGTLRIPALLLEKRDDVRRLIWNVAEAEKAEHPLERIMKVEESDRHVIVTTTGVHLARKLAHELAKQLRKKPRLRYADGEELVHVDWVEPARVA